MVIFCLLSGGCVTAQLINSETINDDVMNEVDICGIEIVRLNDESSQSNLTGCSNKIQEFIDKIR